MSTLNLIKMVVLNQNFWFLSNERLQKWPIWHVFQENYFYILGIFQEKYSLRRAIKAKCRYNVTEATPRVG